MALDSAPSVFVHFREAAEKIGRASAEFHRRLAEDAPDIEKRIAEFDPETVDFMRCTPASDLIGRRLAFSTLVLAQQGWYFSFWETAVADLIQAATWFEEGQSVVADSALSLHVESLVDAMRDHFVKRLPARLQIIDDALDAHGSAKYTLSVPVFLSQADGIGSQLLGVESVYTRSKDGTAQLKKAIRAKTAGFMESDYFYLVASLMPINASFKRRASYPGGLNRNGILHGDTIDYASFVNSCKALSWLQYIVWLCQHCEMIEDMNNAPRAQTGEVEQP